MFKDLTIFNTWKRSAKSRPWKTGDTGSPVLCLCMHSVVNYLFSWVKLLNVDRQKNRDKWMDEWREEIQASIQHSVPLRVQKIEWQERESLKVTFGLKHFSLYPYPHPLPIPRSCQTDCRDTWSGRGESHPDEEMVVCPKMFLFEIYLMIFSYISLESWQNPFSTSRSKRGRPLLICVISERINKISPFLCCLFRKGSTYLNYPSKKVNCLS